MSKRTRRAALGAVLALWTLLLGRPTAADDLEELVANMARVGGCWSPSFSPDGKQIALVSNLSGMPQVYIIDSEGSWPRLVTSLQEPVGAVSWSPDGRWLAFVATGDGSNPQIYLIRPDGSGLRRITEGGKGSNWLGDWSPDGSYVTFAGNRLQPDSMDVFAYDVAQGKVRLLADTPRIGYTLDISHDGNRAILYQMESRGDDNLFLLDVKTGKKTLLTPHDPPGTFEPAHISPDGSTVYFASNKNRERVGLGRVRIDAQGRPGPMEIIAGREDAELIEFQISPDNQTAVLNWNVAGLSRIELLDLRTLAVTPGFEAPTEIVASMHLSADGQQLGMMTFGSAAPPNIVVYDRRNGRLRQVTDSPHAGVDLSSLTRPEQVFYRTHDGLQLSGWLYRPQGKTGPVPTVVIVHGGPEEQERPTFLGTYQGLVQRGIAVFAPNVRGSSGFGKTFVNLDNGALRANAVKDVEATVDFLVEKGIADRERIGIFGFSYGGYLTMASLTRYPELFRAGVNLSGIVNFETFFANTEPWMAAISTVEYGDPKTQVPMLRDLSPIHQIDRVKAPVLVIHGANDINVPVGEAEQIVEHLQKNGVPVEYLLFPDEGHGFAKEDNRIRTSVAVVRWFEKHLEGSAEMRLSQEKTPRSHP